MNDDSYKCLFITNKSIQMQTFLPYPDFKSSAAVLDMRRLGKQRVETLQILSVLLGGSKAWSNHPACKMWRGYEQGLVDYGISITNEWISRGYKDTCLDKIAKFSNGRDIIFPPWFGNEEFHRSHQSNLIRKLPEHYQIYFPDVPNDLPYIWPIDFKQEEKNFGH